MRGCVGHRCNSHEGGNRLGEKISEKSLPLSETLPCKNALEQMRITAIANSSDAHNIAKKRYDLNRREVDFEIDQEVLIKVKSRSKKIGPRWKGPFKIMRKDKDCYELENINKTSVE